MFIPVGIAAWPVLVDLARRQYFLDRQRRQARPFGRMPAPTVTMDRAPADMGSAGDLGDQRTFGAEPAHGDHDLRA